MQEYKDLFRAPAEEQVWWHLVLRGVLHVNDVRWLLCHKLHEDFRFNLREWLHRYVESKIEGIDRLAKRLAIRAVVGLHPSDQELEDESIPVLSFLSDFTYRVFPFNYLKACLPPWDNHEPSAYDLPRLGPPSDPGYSFKFCPHLWSLLPEELQQQVLEKLGVQGICEVIAACYGRGNRAFDQLCLGALKAAIRKGLAALVKGALDEDFRLACHLPPDHTLWPSSLILPVGLFSGFPSPIGDPLGRLYEWRFAGACRACDESESAWRESQELRKSEEAEYEVNKEDGATGWG